MSTKPNEQRKNNQFYITPLVNQTIEYHDQTMIEEFTDAVIPEFTLGPHEFPPQNRPKPLSVNKMGFYEECKNLEEKLSPIKKSYESNDSHRLGKIRQRKIEKEEDMIFQAANQPIFQDEEDNEFYDNQDLFSNESNTKLNSTQKYIELVDSFRNVSKQHENETPSFKCRNEGENQEIQRLKFEDVLNNDIKGTQRSSNAQSDNYKCSSEAQTYRRTSVTRAESDNGESLKLNSKKACEPQLKRKGILRDSIQFDKNRSYKDINIANIMRGDTKHIKVKRKLFVSQNRLKTISSQVYNNKATFDMNCRRHS